MATPKPFVADDLDPAYGSHGANPVGIPYTPEQRHAKWARFINAIQQGASVRKALKTAQITWRTVQLWMVKDGARLAQYARARQNASDIWADRATQEAWRPILSSEDAARNRVRSDVAKWRAAVQDPARWSDKASATNVTVHLTHNSVHLDVLRHRAVTDVPDVPVVEILPAIDPDD